MKTIEERALDIASYAYDFKGKADVESLKGNLALQIRNALAEQKAIDIEKACEWVIQNYLGDYIDSDGYFDNARLANDIRKAME